MRKLQQMVRNGNFFLMQYQFGRLEEHKVEGLVFGPSCAVASMNILPILLDILPGLGWSPHPFSNIIIIR